MQISWLGTDQRGDIMTLLSIQGINKAFQQPAAPLQVLRQINCDIQQGEFVCIVGSSGCGKSTLLRLIAGLDLDFEGQILFENVAIERPDLKRGLIFQEHRLLPWLDVSANIGLALAESALSAQDKQRLVQAHIQMVGLQGFEQAYPHQLSGGMAQRVAIARGLVTQPTILLLDEPFGALDAITRETLQHELQRIWQQHRITMILVTHDIDEAVFLADRVIVMSARPGQIKQIIPIDLPHPRFKQDPRLFAIRNTALAYLQP
jgi:sulfonate transport system ATP-binding protein